MISFAFQTFFHLNDFFLSENLQKAPFCPCPPGDIFCCHLYWQERAIKGNLCLGHMTQLLSIIRHIKSLIV